MNFYDNVAKAYAEIDRLRAELADMTEERNKWRRVSADMSRLHDKSEVAIARVRERCDYLAGHIAEIILRALDGSTE